MGIFDKFKSKKQEDKDKSKEENVLEKVKEEKKSAEKQPLKENTGRAHHILLRPHLSEKTNTLGQHSRYVFMVSANANKIEVKKAVEKVYDVNVVNVNILNIKGKFRRHGRTVGKTKSLKKAIVTLKTGQKISGLDQSI